MSNTSNGYIMLGSGTSSNIILDNNEIMARNNGVIAPLTLQNDGDQSVSGMWQHRQGTFCCEWKNDKRRIESAVIRQLARLCL